MLEVEALTKIYPGPVAALQGVTLRVPVGLFGLLGPNGAGKTTLMRILAGQLAPSSGTVRFAGDDVVEDPSRIWYRLGYLPQDFGFYPDHTGEAMLMHLLRLKGVTGPSGRRALCAELLERVNLSSAARRKIKHYSGGMRQRLGIAQAIAGNPALVVIDEPTAGLDPEERLRLYRLLAELAQERVVLLSTHIVEDVAMLCARFAVLRDGVLVRETTPSAARGALAGAMYEGDADSGAADGLEGAQRITRNVFLEGRNRIRIHSPHATPPAGFTPCEPTLEDAYMLLMQSAGERLQEERS